MADQEPRDDTAADIARATAINAAVSMAIELGVLLGVMWVSAHQDLIARRWKRIRALAARPAGLPDDAGLQLGEFAARVSAWDHGEQP